MTAVQTDVRFARSSKLKPEVNVSLRRCRTFWKKAFENSALLGELMVPQEFL
jgi:hypothetical protein